MRARLFAAIAGVAVLVALAFAIPLAALVRDVARDRALTSAERDASAIAPILALTGDPETVKTAVERTATGADERLTVWLPGGDVVGETEPADDAAVQLARADQRSFIAERANGVVLFTPVVTSSGVAVVAARVPRSLLEAGTHAAWAILAAVAIVLVAAGLYVADRIARTVADPAARLAGIARRLAAGDLEARAEPAGPPELVEVAAAFNHLADRIDALRAAERERVADLSHRLRTPLTAVRLTADASGNAAVIAEIDRLESTVDDIIRTARLPLREDAPRSCDFAAVVRDRSAFWSALAEDQRRSCSVVVPDARVEVPVRADDAAALVDVLVENVFSHTDEEVAYELRLESRGDVARFQVDDAGGGVGPGVEARGSTGSGSTGLGLDIARQVAEAAGGSLAVARSPLGGTRVTVELPLAARPS